MRLPTLCFLSVLLVSLPVMAAKPVKKEASPNEEGAAKVAALVKPSLVKITQIGREGVEGLGSGFVISEDGLIATNMHVVGQGRRLQVETSNGRSFTVKEVYASDYHLDLAILRVDAQGLKPLVLGDSDQVQQGQPIVAMGNPEGLTYSVVQGVVSALREIDQTPMIQVAIPIERGNSGGPLLDRQGHVLGLLTLKSMRTENLGFAMPVNALKRLLAKPNTVPMERWLTLGVLDSRVWQPIMGAKWTQHAGVIKGELPGDGFGGRTLCISQQEEPKVPFEVAVNVRLDNESGAAGLIFCSDGGNRHYGFYPTDGKLRMTRFDGPDVFSWVPFQTVESEAYKPGDWNNLRVRVEADRIIAYINGTKVIEQEDDAFRDGRVGLCKFRGTKAEYKNFRVGSDLRDKPVPEELAQRLGKTLDVFLAQPKERVATLNQLQEEHGPGRRVLNDRIRQLEAQSAVLRQQAANLRKLGTELHQRNVARDLAALLAKPEAEIDLLQAALLISKHDNPEIDTTSSRRLMERMTDELRSDSEIKKGGLAAVKRINRYLFSENGFHGSHYDYENNANSYLNEVLDNREGLPITLSVVFLELASRLEVKGITGISFPSRFMVGYRANEEDEWQLVDVFDGGTLLNVATAAKTVLGDAQAIAVEDVMPATKRQVITRMVRNLLSVAQGEERLPPPEAIPYLSLLIDLEPSDMSSHFQRAAARSSNGDTAGAREDLKVILDNPPPAMSEDQLRDLHSFYQRLGESE